jgi:hypothetical protein
LKCGGYDLADFPAEDLALWLRLSKYGRIVSVPKVLLFYRVSDGSISSQNRISQINKKSQLTEKFDAWDGWLAQCILEFDQTLKLYKRLPNSSERIFLHIRDIVIVSRLMGKPPLSLRLLRKLSVSTVIKIFCSAFSTFVTTYYRRIYRLRKGYF